jgi:hypothetical protein
VESNGAERAFAQIDEIIHAENSPVDDDVVLWLSLP